MAIGSMIEDAGLFGPDSMLWRVNREVTVLFGGARALLLQAAHPLIAAGARQTGAYRRNPWARLIRTVATQHTITFGTTAAALEAADRINKLHTTIRGRDPVTGQAYDALDQDLLLWVHAALEVSSVHFYELTVEPLTDAEKDQYHHEHTRLGELLLLEPRTVPADYAAMERHVGEVLESGVLQLSDTAREVADLITRGAVPWRVKPLWSFIAFAAIGSLPEPVRRLYGLEWDQRRQRVLDLNLAVLRRVRPWLPRRYRWILPARWAYWRVESMRGIPTAASN